MQANDKGIEHACVRLGMKITQVKRILAGKHAVTMSTVERIASAYDIAAYQLLVPGLNPQNPQVLRELTAQETRLYKALEEALEAAKKGGTQ